MWREVGEDLDGTLEGGIDLHARPLSTLGVGFSRKLTRAWYRARI